MGLAVYLVFMHTVYYKWYCAHTNPWHPYRVYRDRYSIYMKQILRWWFSSQKIGQLRIGVAFYNEQECRDALAYVMWYIAEV